MGTTWVTTTLDLRRQWPSQRAARHDPLLLRQERVTADKGIGWEGLGSKGLWFRGLEFKALGFRV